MIKRNNVVVNESKSKDFEKFVSKNVKSKKFWKEINDAASKEIDKKKLDALFEG